jgi:ABC-2 type transport system ATP-binding protein
VTFRYSRRRAPVLYDFTWQVPSGRTVLLGPNGSGKSTILSIAAGALRPVTGWCSFDGVQSGRRRERAAYLARVGWMPQSTRPVPGLRVLDQVAYAGWLQGLGRSEAVVAASTALERVGLTDVTGRRSHELS